MNDRHPLESHYQYLAFAMNGALWLDEVKPGWASQIDTDNLVMWDTYNCIAGQLFREEAAAIGLPSGYRYVYETFEPQFAARHGFVSPRELWIGLIEERLSAPALAMAA